MSRPGAKITVREHVHVARPRDEVFDYTQDYGRRSEWDNSVTAAEILSESPRRIRITVRGLGSFTVAYQLFHPPERTSAAFVDVDSRWMSGGGGSWRYEPVDRGTDWTQTNTLELQAGWQRFLAWLVESSLRSNMRRSMAEAKRRLETAARSPAAGGSPAAAPGGSSD